MKLKLVLLITAFMLVFGTGAANAVMGPSLEILPSGDVDVTGQDTVYFDVIFNPQGTAALDIFAFNMFYDDTELTWNSGLTSLYAPAPLFSQYLGDLDESTSGFIGNINAGGFGGAATLNSPYTLAQLAFDVITPVGDGSPDVWFDMRADVRYGFNFDGVDGTNIQMSQMMISGTGPDVYVAVAPEPVSSTLFIIGAATLGYRRFRKA